MLMPGLAGVQVVSTTLAAKDWETTALLDESRSLLNIVQTVHLGDLQIETLCWADQQGEILKTIVPSLNQTVYRTTKERASQKSEAGEFDLGWDSIVHVATPLPRPHSTRRVVYRASLPDQDPSQIFASGVSQTIQVIDAHTVQITVMAVRPDDPATVGPESPPTVADTSSNNLIQCDDPKIQEMVARAVPTETDPWQTCVDLEKWVHGAIRAKNFGQGFATAADVARTLEGDCTEHAVLLAALCRARQIPARVAVGLVYAPSDQGFAFHMWNEAWISDRWIPLDATLGLGGIGGAHLKLGVSDLSSEQAEATVLRVLQVINRLRLDVLEVD